MALTVTVTGTAAACHTWRLFCLQHQSRFHRLRGLRATSLEPRRRQEVARPPASADDPSECDNGLEIRALHMDQKEREVRGIKKEKQGGKREGKMWFCGLASVVYAFVRVFV